MARDCVERYKDAKGVLSSFTPDMQFELRRLGDDYIFAGPAPTLAAFAEAFGRGAAESWTMIQLENLAQMAGSRAKPSPALIEETAKVIQSEFGFLRLTELMFFFLTVKSGEYGKSYGVLDPLTLTDGLRRFLTRRERAISAIYDKRERLRQEEEKKRHKPITYEQYRLNHPLKPGEHSDLDQIIRNAGRNPLNKRGRRTWQTA